MNSNLVLIQRTNITKNPEYLRVLFIWFVSRFTNISRSDSAPKQHKQNIHEQRFFQKLSVDRSDTECRRFVSHFSCILKVKIPR